MSESEKLFPPTSICHKATKKLWFYRQISFLPFSTLPTHHYHQDSCALSGIITPRDPDPDFHNKNYNGKLKTITRITTNKHQDSGALSGNITPKDPDHGHKSGQFPRGGQVSYID